MGVLTLKKIKFKKNLFVKIVSVFLICILITMLVNLIFATYMSSKALEDEATSSLSRIASEKKQQVDSVFDIQFDVSEAVVNEVFTVNFFNKLNNDGSLNQKEVNQLSQYLVKRYELAQGLYENIFFTTSVALK